MEVLISGVTSLQETELVEKGKKVGKAYVSWPVLWITKADGTKFGKLKEENIWLDAKRTSPYKFYQYWLNTSDADAEKYIKIFYFLTKEALALIVEITTKPTLTYFAKKTLPKK
jgi:tyrosyl-tRNA synthetase